MAEKPELRALVFRARGLSLLLSLLLALIVAPGCAGEPGSDGEPVPGAVLVLDSAGVVIVEHGPLVVEDSTSWVAGFDRAVTIGREEGDPDALIGRVAGFVPLPGGRFMVGDGIGPRVRIFGPDGAFLETVGRPGPGPGEFLNLVGVRAFRGDSVLVMDFEGGRWSILGPDGRFVRHQWPTVAGWDRPGSSPSLQGIFADGTALLAMGRPWEFTEIAVDRGSPINLEILTAEFVRADAEGRILGRFGDHNFSRSVSMVVDGPRMVWDGLRHQGLRAVQGSRVWFGEPMDGEVRVYASDGTLERIIRVTLPGADGPPAEVMRRRAEAGRANAPDDRRGQAFERFAGVTPLPDRLPAFGSLAVDPSGHLWLGPYATDPVEPLVPWYVFDPEGVFTRVVHLPRGFLTQGPFPSAPPALVLGYDHVLARARGELGVETIQRIPLQKD